MPENAPIVIQPASFPEGYCPASWQRFANDLANGMSGYVPGEYNFFNYGDTEPAVSDRTKPWFRLFADGSPDKWYVFANGLWVSPHVLPPGSRAIAPSSLLSAADVWAWDGGDGTDPSVSAPTDASGAMWEVDPAFAAKFPVGIGTFAGGTVVNVSDTGGEDEHVLTDPEVPPHTHKLLSEELTPDSGAVSVDSTNQVSAGNSSGGSDRAYALQGSDDDATIGLSSEEQGNGSGAADGHNNLPPYVGVIFIRRTARLYHVPV